MVRGNCSRAIQAFTAYSILSFQATRSPSRRSTLLNMSGEKSKYLIPARKLAAASVPDGAGAVSMPGGARGFDNVSVLSVRRSCTDSRRTRIISEARAAAAAARTEHFRTLSRRLAAVRARRLATAQQRSARVRRVKNVTPGTTRMERRRTCEEWESAVDATLRLLLRRFLAGVFHALASITVLRFAYVPN